MPPNLPDDAFFPQKKHSFHEFYDVNPLLTLTCDIVLVKSFSWEESNSRSWFYPFRAAEIHASHGFLGAYIRKTCINLNFIDGFFFCMRLFNSIANYHSKFQVEIHITRKYILNKNGKIGFLHFWHKISK